MIAAAVYFAPRYFAPTYWPKLGDVLPVVAAAPTVIFTATLDRLEVTRTPYLMASTMTQPIAIDCVALLLEGETLSSPLVTVTDLATNETYAGGLSGAAAIDGTLIIATVTGLAPGRSYRAAYSATVAVGKVWSREVRIDVPW